MKRIQYILLTAITFAACHHPAASEQQPIPADSMLLHIMRAVMDTNVSCLDYQDEFMMFMDTMQNQVEIYPDEDIRIGVKSLAMDLFSMFIYGDFTTPEENRFFADSLMQPLANIQYSWYIPAHIHSKNFADHYKEPVMEQTLLLRYDDKNHIIFMELYYMPNEDEIMVITLPTEASYLASICFLDEQMAEMDTTATFNLLNARYVHEEEEGLGQQIVYGKDFIDAMLSHAGMYIAYIGDEKANDIKDHWHDAHLSLEPFHKQYQQVKQMLKGK